jgi:hypothetical protein
MWLVVAGWLRAYAIAVAALFLSLCVVPGV